MFLGDDFVEEEVRLRRLLAIMELSTIGNLFIAKGTDTESKSDWVAKLMTKIQHS